MTLQFNRVIGSICAKLDESTLSGLISFEFTRLYSFLSIMNFNSDLQNQEFSSSPLGQDLCQD